LRICVLLFSKVKTLPSHERPASGILQGMAKSIEKRRRVRVPLRSKVRHSEYQVLGTPVFEENSTLDLSTGGISFETKREYRVGNLVILDVEIRGERLKLLVCVARIEKVKPGTFRVGAEVIALDPAHKERMKAHLDALISENAALNRKPTKKKAIRKKTAKKKTAKKKTQSRKMK
jgi:hypothetical protein